MKPRTIYFLVISLSFLFANSLVAQNTKDSLANSYSKKLIGTWIGKIEMIEKRLPLADTTVYTYDTLIISSDKTYYLSQGGNTEKHWVGFVSTGTWEINTKPVAYIELNEKYNNRNLGMSQYPYTITKVTEIEFRFVYDDRSYTYKRLK